MPRTTARWLKEPGGLDVLHQSAKYGVTAGPNTFGIPNVQSPHLTPLFGLVRYGFPGPPREGAIAHFFTDDYRFEGLWTYPQRGLQAVRKYTAVCGPDFSCLVGWPWAVNLWNVYRSRWLTAYWQRNGVIVIPTVTWADYDTYDFAFVGIPPASMIAVASPATHDAYIDERFLFGWRACLLALRPAMVVCYGQYLTDDMREHIRQIGLSTQLLVFPRSGRIDEKSSAP